MTKRAITSELQTITAKVMKRYMSKVERGQGKYERPRAGAEYADTVHRSVAELHHDPGPEIAVAETRWDALREEAEKVAARVAKLKTREELTTKEVKRLETCERRLQSKEGGLAELEAETLRLQRIAEEEQTHIAQARKIADELKARPEAPGDREPVPAAGLSGAGSGSGRRALRAA